MVEMWKHKNARIDMLKEKKKGEKISCQDEWIALNTVNLIDVDVFMGLCVHATLCLTVWSKPFVRNHALKSTQAAHIVHSHQNT